MQSVKFLLWTSPYFDTGYLIVHDPGKLVIIASINLFLVVISTFMVYIFLFIAQVGRHLAFPVMTVYSKGTKPYPSQNNLRYSPWQESKAWVMIPPSYEYPDRATFILFSAQEKIYWHELLDAAQNGPVHGDRVVEYVQRSERIHAAITNNGGLPLRILDLPTYVLHEDHARQTHLPRRWVVIASVGDTAARDLTQALRLHGDRVTWVAEARHIEPHLDLDTFCVIINSPELDGALPAIATRIRCAGHILIQYGEAASVSDAITVARTAQENPLVQRLGFVSPSEPWLTMITWKDVSSCIADIEMAVAQIITPGLESAHAFVLPHARQLPHSFPAYWKQIFLSLYAAMIILGYLATTGLIALTNEPYIPTSYQTIRPACGTSPHFFWIGDTPDCDIFHCEKAGTMIDQPSAQLSLFIHLPTQSYFGSHYTVGVDVEVFDKGNPSTCAGLGAVGSDTGTVTLSMCADGTWKLSGLGPYGSETQVFSSGQFNASQSTHHLMIGANGGEFTFAVDGQPPQTLPIAPIATTSIFRLTFSENALQGGGPYARFANFTYHATSGALVTDSAHYVARSVVTRMIEFTSSRSPDVSF